MPEVALSSGAFASECLVLARYRLHCTNGVDFVVDKVGVDMADYENLARVAFGSALGLMRSLPSYRDWASWVVAVHDEDGYQVDTISFPDQRVFGDLLCQAGSEHEGAQATLRQELE